MLKIGHRGARLQATENTLLSFKKAIASGVDMVELDVQKTKDDVLVVIHDPTIDRTTNGSGYVKEMTYDELSSYKSAEGETIPTLDEVYALCIGKVQVLTEIKAMGCLALLTDLIDKHGNRNEIVVQSFLHGELVSLREYDDAIRTAALFDELWVDGETIRDYLKSIHANGANINFKKATKDIIESMHGAGQFIYVWGGSTEDVEGMDVDGITVAL